MKYFSMFSGIGGFELGIQNATNSDWECIGYSEIDKYAVEIYNSHFKHNNYGDATKINTTELPDFQFLCGGFPCQAFSVAGKRKGFNDVRGTLFFEIARILRDKKPKYFLLENVQGLLSHENGDTFQEILRILTELGYRIQWQLLNSKDYGVPQSRERIFIAGCFGEAGRFQIFPISESTAIYNKQKEANEKIHKNISTAGTLTARQYVSWNGNYIEDVNIAVSSLTRRNKKQNGRRFKENNEPMFTLTGQDRHGIYDGTQIRQLTPTECERLQGFPDGWTSGISDSQRYKSLGNAVTVNVVEAIIRKFPLT